MGKFYLRLEEAKFNLKKIFSADVLQFNNFNAVSAQCI